MDDKQTENRFVCLLLNKFSLNYCVHIQVICDEFFTLGQCYILSDYLLATQYYSV